MYNLQRVCVYVCAFDINSSNSKHQNISLSALCTVNTMNNVDSTSLQILIRSSRPWQWRFNSETDLTHLTCLNDIVGRCVCGDQHKKTAGITCYVRVMSYYEKCVRSFSFNKMLIELSNKISTSYASYIGNDILLKRIYLYIV